MVSVTATLAVRPVTRVSFRVTVVPALPYFSPAVASFSLRCSSADRVASSARAMPEDSLTSPEKPSVSGLSRSPWPPSTKASVRSVKTASASRWNVASVRASTVGPSRTAAPALQLGSRATPATTEVAAAPSIGRRRRVPFNFLDFTDAFPSCPRQEVRGQEIFA